MFTSKARNFWKGKNIFITGHTGFKGSWLCLLLNELGSNVSGFSLKPYKSNIIFEDLKIKKYLTYNFYGDIKDKKRLNFSIKKVKPEIIFHLAAQPIVLDSYLNPNDTFETNINGTLNILEAIKRYQVRSSVIVTTDKVYKNKNKKISFRENDILEGDDPYSASKAMTEMLVHSYNYSFFKNKIKVATVRAGNIIGGGDRASKRILPDFFKCFERKNKLFVRSPDSLRPWQFILEPLIGYLLVAEANYNKKFSSNVKQTWNFSPSNNKIYTVKEVIKKINSYFNILINYKNKPSKKEKKYLKLSSSKAHRLLGWKSHYNIDKTINEIAKWEINRAKGNEVRSLSLLQINNYLKLLKW